MLSRALDGFASRFRQFLLRWHGASLGKSCWLRKIEVPRNYFDVQLGEGVALDRGVTLLATGEQTTGRRIRIGNRSYVNRHTMIDASVSIEIGDCCMIGPFCYITDHDHGMERGVSIQSQPLVGLPVVIEDDVWIGAHVTILKGVRIQSGAVIGAGAVVTRSVAANSIVAGVPAREIGSRENPSPDINGTVR